MNSARLEGSPPDTGRKGGPYWGWAWTALRALLTLLILSIFAVAYLEGILFNALFLLLIILAPVTLLDRIYGALRRRLEYGFFRHPFRRGSRPYLLQCLNRWMFWVMVAVTLALSLVPTQFEPDELLAVRVVIGLSLAILIGLQLVPRHRVGLFANIAYALGWAFLVAECLRIVSPHPTSDGIAIAPPFRGEWLVMQGGRSPLVNHHYPIRAQRYALDLVMLVDGREVKGDPDRIESYAAYGQPLYAPAEGRVSRVVDDRPDMAIGQADLDRIVGNHVVIEVGASRYVLMAHLMKGSVLVSEGERVRLGQPVARCGNSGNTSAPHLHLQVQSGPDFEEGHLETVPIIFRDIELVRWGRVRRGTIGDLRRNDRIIPRAP